MSRNPRVEQEADRLRTRAALLQLKALRVEKEINQRDMAEEIGTQQSAISEIETLAEDVRISTLHRYARAVGARLVIGVERDANV